MFGFSRRRMKLGRLRVQLSDSAQGTRSPIRHPKRFSNSNGEGVAAASSEADELNCQSSSNAPELNNCTSGSSENWMVLSISGEKPTPRFNHAAAVVGNKMVVVGGESANGLLEDVQVLSFDRFSWTMASSKLYLSPTSLPLKIPACKGPLGEEGASYWRENRTFWAFDMEAECWSPIEAKGDIPVARSGHTVVRANSVLILFGGEDTKRRKLNDLHMFDLKSLTWLPLHCTGPRPSARSNHIAALYNDKMLFIFGGSSKSRTLNDLYSLDFEAMVWSRIKTRGFHPSPRAGCCGALCGTKWYITGGGSKKKRPAETLIFDVLKFEWSIAVSSPPSSITTNKMMEQNTKPLDSGIGVSYSGDRSTEETFSSESDNLNFDKQGSGNLSLESEDLVFQETDGKSRISAPSASVELAQEEANSLSNIVHSDNVRLEHDVAFLKAVLDDTQKELHSTRGVLAGERARAFQLQVEVFHLKQRLQTLETRAPTPRKPFHV
ncbi:UNVERIFIED_CONTAM: Dynein regulatory complex subunit [Sesamum radiatum]|uniref:Dynein regulatory complex subunit n=1 Tax=Sesamum radiatum TaxID=300843 RepID=A0AAW2UDK7_SESRA